MRAILAALILCACAPARAEPWMWFPVVTCAMDVVCGLPPDGWHGRHALPTERSCEGFAFDALKVINRTEDSAAIHAKYAVHCIKENPAAP